MMAERSVVLATPVASAMPLAAAPAASATVCARPAVLVRRSLATHLHVYVFLLLADTGCGRQRQQQQHRRAVVVPSCRSSPRRYLINKLLSGLRGRQRLQPSRVQEG